MGEELKRLSAETSNLKKILLQDKNIDILLYLAKYNPEVTIEEISKKFGKDVLDDLKSLKEFHLINENNGNLVLTDEGIFQVEGLLTLA